MGHPDQLSLFDVGGIDVQGLKLKREALRAVPKAAQTSRSYASDWGIFCGWCASAGRGSAPAAADTVELYVTWMVSEGRRASTAARHLASIASYHRQLGLTVPDLSGARSLLAAAVRERSEVPEGRTALTVSQLVALSRCCSGGTAFDVRDRALMVLGFATSLRRSELVALDLADVGFHAQGLAVLVRRSKTDQAGRGRVVGVWAGKRALTDPVRVLRAWVRLRGSWAGPLFTRVQTGGRVTHARLGGESVNDIVQRRAAAAGLVAGNYGAHSLRAGALTASAEVGRQDQEIMRLSGHASAAVMQKYVRHARVFTGRNPLAGVL